MMKQKIDLAIKDIPYGIIYSDDNPRIHVVLWLDLLEDKDEHLIVSSSKPTRISRINNSDAIISIRSINDNIYLDESDIIESVYTGSISYSGILHKRDNSKSEPHSYPDTDLHFSTLEINNIKIDPNYQWKDDRGNEIICRNKDVNIKNDSRIDSLLGMICEDAYNVKIHIGNDFNTKI